MNNDINVGALAEAINDKVDLDLNNLSTQGRSTGGGLAFPSDKSVALTLNASGTIYIAPGNGFLAITRQVTAASQSIVIRNVGKKLEKSQYAGTSNGNIYFYVPCKKGDNMQVIYNAAGTLHFFGFIYTEGDK